MRTVLSDKNNIDINNLNLYKKLTRQPRVKLTSLRAVRYWFVYKFEGIRSSLVPMSFCSIVKATCVTDVSIVHPNVFVRCRVAVTPSRGCRYVVLSGHSVVQFARVLTEMPLNPTSTLATATAIQTIRLFTAPYQRAAA